MYLPADVRDRLLLECPWLRLEDVPIRRLGPRGVARRRGDHGDDRPYEEEAVVEEEGTGASVLVVPPELDAVEFEDAVADAAAELATVRADIVVAENQDYFYTRVLGGRCSCRCHSMSM